MLLKSHAFLLSHAISSSRSSPICAVACANLSNHTLCAVGDNSFSEVAEFLKVELRETVPMIEKGLLYQGSSVVLRWICHGGEDVVLHFFVSGERCIHKYYYFYYLPEYSTEWYIVRYSNRTKPEPFGHIIRCRHHLTSQTR